MMDMSPHQAHGAEPDETRRRRLVCLCWFATAANLLLAGVWVTSGWANLLVVTNRVSFALSEGVTKVDLLGPYHRPPPQRVGITVGWGGPRAFDPFFWQRARPLFTWIGPYHYSSWGTTTIVTPLWLLQGVCALPAIVLWIVWRRSCRRYRAGHCRRCGYDLTGNVSGVCPECGVATLAVGNRPQGDSQGR